MDVAGVCARDLMRTDVRTVSEKTTLLAAAKLMQDKKVSSLVVEPSGAHDAFGIVTRKDVVEALLLSRGDVERLLVIDVMTKPAIFVAPDLSIAHCVRMMRMVGVRRVPVVDSGKLVGILSNTDVFRHLVAGIESAGDPVA